MVAVGMVFLRIKKGLVATKPFLDWAKLPEQS
jgi:hypothetical protein